MTEGGCLGSLVNALLFIVGAGVCVTGFRLCGYYVLAGSPAGALLALMMFFLSIGMCLDSWHWMLSRARR